MRNRFPFQQIIVSVTCLAILAAAFLFPSAASAKRAVFPDVIALPDGWLPEGIAIGPRHTFYAGSRANGAIYRGDLRTGEGEIFIEGVPGRVAVGLKYDRECKFLLVSGGGTGQGFIYDGRSGDELQMFQFTTGPAFINDVIVTEDAAYFTNSQAAELYRVDLTDCALPADFDVLPLSGDWQQVTGFNANGIVADDEGQYLIVVNSTLGNLYRVDAETGAAQQIDLGAEGLVTNGDGLALRDGLLYVVRNRLNEVVVIDLNEDWTTGEVVDTITSPLFDVPTTIAFFGNALYAVNARFTTPPTPTTPYTVVRVELNKH